MSKSLRSYPDNEKPAVVKRRLQEARGGLGFWAAMDYKKAESKKAQSKNKA